MIRTLCFLTLALCALCRVAAQPELIPITIQDERDVRQLIDTLDAPNLPDAARANAAKRLALLNPPEALPALLRALDDPAFGVRQYAARALGLIGDRAATPALVAHSTEPDREARIEIVVALGRLADPRAVEALAGALNDAEDNIRLAAATALGHIPGPASSAALRGIIADDAHPGAVPALLSLGRRGDHAVTPVCLRRIEQAGFNDPQVAQALAESGDPAALDTLATLFNHENQEIRKAACMGMARIGTDDSVAKLVDLMEAHEKELRSTQETDQVWSPALGMLTPMQVDKYLAPWLSTNKTYLLHPVSRLLATHYQGDFTMVVQLMYRRWSGRDWFEQRQSAEAVKPLLQKLDRDIAYTLASPRQWRDSSQLDGLLGPPAPPIAFNTTAPERGCWVSTPEITQLLLGGTELRDGLQGSRVYRACFTGDHALGAQICRLITRQQDAPSIFWFGMGLRKLADPCAMPTLLAVLENADTQARNGLWMGLAGCADGRDAASYQVLLDHLTAENSVVRQGAIVGLGSCRDARAVPSLIVVLKTDAVPEVREFAALALGLIGDTRAVTPLCAALNDGVEWARSAAAWALGEIGDPRAIAPLQNAALVDANQRFRVRVYRSLYLLGDREAAAKLTDLVTSEDWITREVAYQALLESNEPGIAGSLLARLAEKPDPLIIGALGRQHAQQAISMLLAILAEPEYSYQGTSCRQAVCRALGLIAEGRRVERVDEVADALYRAATTDVEPQVRAQAALALARTGDTRALGRLEWVMQYYVPERNAAIRALWRIPDQHATELLLACLSDDDPLGKVLAARGLCLRNEPHGPAALKTLLLAAGEPVAKQVAIRFAADLRDPELAPFFIKLAKAQHEEASIFIVLEAIAALGKTSTPEAEQALLELLTSPASRLREAAALALTGTTSPAALAALRACLETEESTRARAAMQAVVG